MHTLLEFPVVGFIHDSFFFASIPKKINPRMDRISFGSAKRSFAVPFKVYRRNILPEIHAYAINATFYLT